MLSLTVDCLLTDLARVGILWLANFIETLHEAILSGLRDGVDEIQINGAIQTQQGWMHIHGTRSAHCITLVT